MAIGDFEIQKKNLQEKIDAADEEGQMTGNFTEYESLNKQMEDLLARKSTFEKVADKAEQGPSESDVKQVEGLGGSVVVLDEKLEKNKEEVKETEEVVEVAEVKMADGDIDHKVNEDLEPGLPEEEVVNNPNFKEQDAQKLEQFKDSITQKMNAAVEEFKASGDVSVLNKFQKSLDAYLDSNLDTPGGHFLKDVDAQVEKLKAESVETMNPQEDLNQFLTKLKQENIISDREYIPGEAANGAVDQISARIISMQEALPYMTKDHQENLQRFSKIADEVIMLKGWRPVFEKDAATAVDEASDIQAHKKVIDAFAGPGEQRGWSNSGMVQLHSIEEALKESPSITLRERFKKQEEDQASKIKRYQDYLETLKQKIGSAKESIVSS